MFSFLFTAGDAGWLPAFSVLLFSIAIAYEVEDIIIWNLRVNNVLLEEVIFLVEKSFLIKCRKMVNYGDFVDTKVSRGSGNRVGSIVCRVIRGTGSRR